jgi:hypothetical protein
MSHSIRRAGESPLHDVTVCRRGSARARGRSVRRSPARDRPGSRACSEVLVKVKAAGSLVVESRSGGGATRRRAPAVGHPASIDRRHKLAAVTERTEMIVKLVAAARVMGLRDPKTARVRASIGGDRLGADQIGDGPRSAGMPIVLDRMSAVVGRSDGEPSVRSRAVVGRSDGGSEVCKGREPPPRPRARRRTGQGAWCSDQAGDDSMMAAARSVIAS